MRRSSFLFLPFLFLFLISSTLTLSILSGCSHNQTKEKNFFRALWIKNLDPKSETGNLPISFLSPLIYEDMLFSGDGSGFLHAYNVENGRELWKAKEKNEITTAPAVFKDMVIYGTADGRVIARNTLNGEIVYSVDLGDSVETAASLDDKERAYVQLRSHKVYSIDANTGKILWNYNRTISLKTTIHTSSTPKFFKNRVYVGFADGSVVALSADDGSLVWERNISIGSKFIDVDMTPTFHDGLLYICSRAGVLTILNPDTGVILRKFDHKILRPPLFINEHMLIGSENGHLYKLDKLGNIIDEKDFTHPILHILQWQNNILLTTQGSEVFVLNPQKLQTLDTFTLGHRYSLIFGDPTINKNKLGLFSSRNRLYVFEPL
ncbi:MAG: PQQ-binding-like beta-propeller repeat protein [Oligoflexia bacterium]|nr:PQQ-binding-like beta-propeller repeat protein [Oligoflexia bacterium]